MTPVRMIVDTDTAGDDVASLLIALRHPNAQLVHRRDSVPRTSTPSRRSSGWPTTVRVS